MTNVVAAFLGALALSPIMLTAQDPPPCQYVLCSPTLTFESALNHSHLGGGPTVQSLSTGAVGSLAPRNNLELLFIFGVPTYVQHLSVVFSAQWLPTAKTSANPYTEYTAGELGGPVRAPGLSVTFGLAYDAVTPALTDGWLTLTPFIGDNFSPAALPTDNSAFTHKLDLNIQATVHVLHRLPKRYVILRGIGVFALFDYRASGLPTKGDEVPAGQRVFLTNARPATLLAGLSVPIVPLKVKP